MIAKRAIKRRALVVGALFALSSLAAAIAFAEDVDPKKPRTFVTGAPSGASIGARVDPHRSGLAADALPKGPLRIFGQTLNGVGIEHAPIVRADGTIALVNVRGDVFYVSPQEAHDSHPDVSTAEPPGSPPVLLSSGNLGYLSSSGRAVIVSRERVLYTNLVARERPVKVAPLALPDGGFVVATLGELLAIDAEGQLRHRAPLGMIPTGALLSNGHEILVVGADGTVFGWTPGDDPHRIGSFESPIDGNAALGAGGLLYAVARGNRILELDLARGSMTTRAQSGTGLLLGPPAVRPGAITVLGYDATHTYVVTFGADGQEASRVSVHNHTAATLPDGGAPTLTAPAHTGPIVDGAGAVAFMTPDGTVGVVSADGSGVDTLGEIACGAGVGRRTAAQLAPAGPGMFVLACETGRFARITTKQVP